MSTPPSGKRSWKCPECGSEGLLSVAQLDPIACEACLKKMKGEGGATSTSSMTSIAAGPIGIWSSLPDMTKLVIVLVALVVGFVAGYQFGQKASPPPPVGHRSSSHVKEPAKSEKSEESMPSDDSATESETETRPDPPGPGYKWVRGRKHKDGTYGKGHWAKDPRAVDSKDSE